MTTSTLDHVWHAVARVADVGAAPFAVELLGHDLVLAELDGTVVAFDDVCVHRGAALSLGKVVGGCIECPYHGWQYRADGGCASIPALPAGRRIPPTARVGTRRCAVRSGLVWVCLDEPRTAVPSLPEEADGWRVIVGEPYEWSCEPSRRIENFLDFAHFAFVHDGLLGDREQPLVPAHEVWRDGDELRIHQVRDEPTRGGVKPAGAASDAFATTVDYRVFLPHAAVLDQRMPGGERFVLGIASTPLAGGRSRSFWVLARDYDLDGPDEPYVAFQTAINAQDRPVIESLRPGFVPLDLTDELHLRDVDAVAVAYRRELRDLTRRFTQLQGQET
jgi:vanillate O-demethylase monooxygenase subunit